MWGDRQRAFSRATLPTCRRRHRNRNRRCHAPRAPATHSPPAGIGFACAQALCAAGVRVLVADIDAEAVAGAERQLTSLGYDVLAAVCDVGDRRQVDAMVVAAVARWGGIDIAVANAGIVRSADFLEMTEEDFDAVIRVNLKGVFLVRAGGGGPCQLLFAG